MTEYWKSLPKHYCDYCKVWIADNKISVQHHEGGERHKANVQRRLSEIHRAKTQAERAQKVEELEIQRMNAAALHAVAKDIMNPQIAAAYGDQDKSRLHMGDWHLAKTKEGHVYYWNDTTREVRWTLPKGLKAAEQKEEESGEQKPLKLEKRLERDALVVPGPPSTPSVYQIPSAYYELCDNLQQETAKKETMAGMLTTALIGAANAGTDLAWPSVVDEAGTEGARVPIRLKRTADLQLPADVTKRRDKQRQQLERLERLKAEPEAPALLGERRLPAGASVSTADLSDSPCPPLPDAPKIKFNARPAQSVSDAHKAALEEFKKRRRLEQKL